MIGALERLGYRVSPADPDRIPANRGLLMAAPRISSVSVPMLKFLTVVFRLCREVRRARPADLPQDEAIECFAVPA